MGCVEATTRNGAIVHFVPPAGVDIVDGNTVVTCTLPSGSYFPIGVNTVVCTTSDSRGNHASKTFTIKVCELCAVSCCPAAPCPLCGCTSLTHTTLASQLGV
jgi:hypothetical protein